MDTEGDNSIYRFCGPHDCELLSTRRLWLSSVKDFNDPFEMVPRHDEYMEKRTDEMLKQQWCFSQTSEPWLQFSKRMKHLLKKYGVPPDFVAEKQQRNFDNNFGMVCFCKEMKCILMWGHYAKSHTGFVIEFDLRHPFFNPTYFAKVEYSDTRPALPDDDTVLVLQKGTKWRYEQEHRMILPLLKLPKAVHPFYKVEKTYIELPITAVKAIYIGIRMANERPADLQKLLDSLKSPDAEHIKCFGMQRHSRDYAVEAIPWAEVRSYKSDMPEFKIVHDDDCSAIRDVK
jgi:hypothetical protein